MRAELFISYLLAAGFTGSLHAQFVTPIPRHPSDSAAGLEAQQQVRWAAFKDSIADIWRARCSSVDPDSTPSLVIAGANACDHAASRVAEDSLRVRLEAEYRDSCVSQWPRRVRDYCLATWDERQAIRKWKGRGANETILLFPTSRRELAPLYGQGLQVFSQFAADISEDEIFVLTEVISGAVGVFPFAITHAAVVSKADTARGLAAETVQDVRSRVLRLINNGGTLSMRITYPIYAGGATNIQDAISVHAQAGMIGPLGSPDSVDVSTAVVMEWMRSYAIRMPDLTSALLGELIWGLRTGFVLVPNRVLVGVNNDRWIPFLQGAIGLRQSGILGLSVLVSTTPFGDSDEFLPRIILNLSLLR